MSEAELQRLAADVRDLKDRAEIVDCLTRYTRGADRLDRELVLSAYHPDATDDRGAFTGGPQARVRWLFEYLSTLAHTTHHISNFTIEIEGDVAHSECYVITTLMPREAAEATIGTARYLDRLERRQGEWRIAHREAVMDFMVTLPTAPMHANVLTGSRDRDDRSYARPLQLSAEGAARMNARAHPPGE